MPYPPRSHANITSQQRSLDFNSSVISGPIHSLRRYIIIQSRSQSPLPHRSHGSRSQRRSHISFFRERGVLSMPVAEEIMEKNAWGAAYPHAKHWTHPPKEYGIYTATYPGNKQPKEKRHQRLQQLRHSEQPASTRR